MSNQRRSRRPFLSIGLLMRRFSRALTQRYIAEDDSLDAPEEEISEWDDTPETPAPARARAVARPVTSVDDAIKAAERPTSSSSRPVQRAAAPKPAPPRPVLPPSAPVPLPVVNPTPQPIVQRAPEPIAAPSPAPVESSQPPPAQAATPTPQQSGEMQQWPEGVPRTWNGLPIPVSNTPTPPALKAWIQRERDREVRRKELLEERKEQLLSELPPPPEDPNAPRGRRLRPRGHTGVDYINTASLRGDEPHQPVQRNFDLSLGDSSGQPPAAPREPSTPQGGQVTSDDDETSTPIDGLDSNDYHTAIDAAIQRAESITPSELTDFDDLPPNSRPRRTSQPESSDEMTPPVVGGAQQPSASSPDVQRAESDGQSTPPAPIVPIHQAPPPPVITLVQRAEDESRAPSALDIPDPSIFAAQTEADEGQFDDWDAEDAPDMPDGESSSAIPAAHSEIQRQADFDDISDAPEDDFSPFVTDVSDSSAPAAPTIQRQSAIDAAIQQAESPSISAPFEAAESAPESPRKTGASPVSRETTPAAPIQPMTPAPIQRTSADAPSEESANTPVSETPSTPTQRTAAESGNTPVSETHSTPIQRTSAESGNTPVSQTPSAPIQRTSAEASVQRIPAEKSDATPVNADSVGESVQPDSPASRPTPQASLDAAIQRAESVTSSSDADAPRKPSKRKAAQNPPAAPAEQPSISAVQRVTDPAPVASSSSETAPTIQRAPDSSEESDDAQADLTEAFSVATPAADSIPHQTAQTAIQRSEKAIGASGAPISTDSVGDVPVESHNAASIPDTGGIQRSDEPLSQSYDEGFSPATQTPIQPNNPSDTPQNLQRQSPIDAAIQRAEAPSASFEEGVTWDDDAGWSVPARVDADETQMPSADVDAAPQMTSTSADMPIQRVVSRESAPLESQMPNNDSGTVAPSVPTDISAPSYQTAIDAAIQRAETPVQTTPPSVSSPMASSSAPAQGFVPPTRTPDNNPRVNMAGASPSSEGRTASDPTGAPSGMMSQSTPIQRAALDDAIRQAETVSPSAQPFMPRTRTTGGNQPTVTSPQSASTVSPNLMRQEIAPEIAQPSFDGAVDAPISQPSFDQPNSPSAQPLSPAPNVQTATDAAIQRAEWVDNTASENFPTTEATSRVSAGQPIQRSGQTALPDGVESASPLTVAPDGTPIQPMQRTSANHPSDSVSFTPDGTPIQRTTTPNNTVSQAAALDTAIQRAEAISAPVARPFVPTARKLTDSAPHSTSIQRVEADSPRSGEAMIGNLPAPEMPYDVDDVDVPFGAIQRDADDFGAWETIENDSASSPEQLDLHQAMAAAGMVPPPVTSASPIQRTEAYAAAKGDAINRAEQPASRPDIAQALKTAGMVSDANAQLQRSTEVESVPVSATSVPVYSPLQRALGTDVEVRSEEERPLSDKEGVPPNIDIDRLANDVYRVLREKLRVDAERRAK